MNTYVTGSTIKQLRETRNLTQAELAEKLKMRVKGLSAKTKLYFFPNAFVREFIGLLWEKKWKHLLFIFLFFAVLLVLYLIIRY